MFFPQSVRLRYLVTMAGSVDRPKQGEMMTQVWDMSRRVQLETAGDQTRDGAAWSVDTRIIQYTGSETRLEIRLPAA